MTLAAWRLQLTAVLLLVGAAAQWRRADARTRRAAVSAAPLLLASGCWLAAHFGFWVASLQMTSLAHSVLIVSLSPVLLVLHARVFHGAAAVAPGEAFGVALAAAGALVLSLGAAGRSNAKGAEATAAAAAAAGGARDVPATLLGDAAAFGACASVIGYLLIGRRLRGGGRGAAGGAGGGPTQAEGGGGALLLLPLPPPPPPPPPPLPLCVYAAPVTAVAAALLSAAGFLFETAPGPAEGVFGWLGSAPAAASAAGAAAAETGAAAAAAATTAGAAAAAAAAAPASGLRLYGPRVLYLAVGPGLVGHTGFNFLLAHVPPLAVSLALDLEGVVAPAMARLLGVTLAPLGLSTWAGGAALVAAAAVATAAGAAREAAEARGRAGVGGGVAMARLPSREEGDEGDEGDEAGNGGEAPSRPTTPVFSLAADEEEEEHGAPRAKGAAIAPEWAGLHRHHRQ